MEGLYGGERVRGVNLGGWLVIEGWIKPSLFDDIVNGDLLVSVSPSISVGFHDNVGLNHTLILYFFFFIFFEGN